MDDEHDGRQWISGECRLKATSPWGGSVMLEGLSLRLDLRIAPQPRSADGTRSRPTALRVTRATLQALSLGKLAHRRYLAAAGSALALAIVIWVVGTRPPLPLRSQPNERASTPTPTPANATLDLAGPPRPSVAPVISPAPTLPSSHIEPKPRVAPVPDSRPMPAVEPAPATSTRDPGSFSRERSRTTAPPRRRLGATPKAVASEVTRGPTPTRAPLPVVKPSGVGALAGQRDDMLDLFGDTK